MKLLINGQKGVSWLHWLALTNGFVHAIRLSERSIIIFLMSLVWLSPAIALDITYSVQMSPTTLDFGSVNVGSQSTEKFIQIKNTGSGVLTFSQKPYIGLPYKLTSNTCASTLAAGTTCDLGISFSPTQSGGITDYAIVYSTEIAGSSLTYLQGTGTSGVAVLTTTTSTTAAPTTTVATTTTTTTTQANVYALSGISIQGPASINENSNATYSIVITYSNGNTRTLTTKTSSGLFGGTDYSLYYLSSLSSSVSSSVTSTDLNSKFNFSISSAFADGSSVSSHGFFAVAGASATSPGATFVSAANVTQDQPITLSASYTEGGLSKQATLLVTIKDLLPLTTTSTTTTSAPTTTTVAATTTTSTTTTSAPTTTTTVAATTTTTQQISHTLLQIAVGWNLLGNTTDQAINVADAFNSTSLITTVWKWDAATGGWQFYAPSMDAATLQTYVASKGYGLLSVINPGEGYWVNAKTASSLASQAGTGFNLTAEKIAKGWNLVATGNDVTPAAFNLSLSATPPTPGTLPLNLTTLWAWDNSASQWYFYAPQLDASGGLANYITSKGYLDFSKNNKTLGKGLGFWVNKP